MALMDSLISQHGETVTPYYETKGDADSYGDRATTWTARNVEIVWIQSRREARDVTIAGRFMECEYRGFLKSDSAIQEGDHLLVDSTKYEVVHVDEKKLYGAVNHKECFLKIMVE